LSWNDIASSSADVFSVVATNYVILDNLLHTTKIISFLATNGNLAMKSTVKCVYSFSGISFAIGFPANASVLFFIL